MIAIKDMEMLGHCGQCNFCKEEDAFDSLATICELLNQDITWNGNRAENCPLVEIVTCKDCKYKSFFASDGKGNTIYVCDKHFKNITSDDSYCSDGEWRE